MVDSASQRSAVTHPEYSIGLRAFRISAIWASARATSSGTLLQVKAPLYSVTKRLFLFAFVVVDAEEARDVQRDERGVMPRTDGAGFAAATASPTSCRRLSSF